MIVKCKKCSKQFNKYNYEIKKSKNHFCSRTCSNSFNQYGKPAHNRAISRICKSCKSQFCAIKPHRLVIFCSSCTDNNATMNEFIKNLTLTEYYNRESVKGKHPSWRTSVIRQLSRSWNRELTKLPCANCSYSKHVELCHKKPITAFPQTATLEEVNHPSNNIQLCPNCHWELDNGLLQLITK